MPPIRLARMLLALHACGGLGFALAGAPLVVTLSCAKSAASAPKTYHATGVIRSFGPNRAYVNIAHDAIPGYMGAMTMSFEPKTASQLDGLVANDAVELDFTETDDGRRVLVSLRKRK